MKPSTRIRNFVKEFEQLRLKAYMPTPEDRPTIGYGETGPHIKLGMTWTADGEANKAPKAVVIENGAYKAM